MSRKPVKSLLIYTKNGVFVRSLSEFLFQTEIILPLFSGLLFVFFSKEILWFRKSLFGILRKSPGFIKNLYLWVRIRHTKKTKKLRRIGDEVTYQTIRAHTYFILFIGSIAFYLALISLGPLKGMGELPASMQYVITAPIYFFEAVWLLQTLNARELISSRSRLKL